MQISPIPSLADLSDVNLSSPVLDDVLHFNGTEWVNTNISTIAPSNNVYNSDGVLTGNRTLDGDNFNYDLNILNTNNFSINTFELNLNSDDHAQLSSNGYVNLSANTSGSFSANRNLSLNAGTIAELTAVNEVNLIAPKTTVSKDFSEWLNISYSNRYFKHWPVEWKRKLCAAFEHFAKCTKWTSLISSNVELGGILLHDTSIDGDANQFSLFYDQLKNFNSSTIDTYLYGSNSVTLESDNNINLLSNGNLSGGVAHNTDLRSIPDWDLTSIWAVEYIAVMTF